MTQISEIRRDVERMMAMGSDIDKKLTALEERRQEECNDGLEGLPFLEIEARGNAYPLTGHLMAAEKEKDKISYVKALVFTILLLRPYAKDLVSGFTALERIRCSLGLTEDLKLVLAEGVSWNKVDILPALIHIRDGRGKDAFLLDSLILASEMKSFCDPAFKQLSYLHALMGYGERTVEEALEAVETIYAGDRREFLQAENNWHSFHGDAAACYLDLAGDLNRNGALEVRTYYAFWPEAGVQGPKEYTPCVMLIVNATEGKAVHKGDPLFTIYGGNEKYSEWGSGRSQDFLKELSGFTIKYSDTSQWIYLMHPSEKKNGISNSNRYEHICDALESIKIKGSAVKVKADADGIVHWEECIAADPFDTIKKVDYQVGDDGGIFGDPHWTDGEVLVPADIHFHAKYKGAAHVPVTAGDVFLSSDTLKPETMRRMPLCKVKSRALREH